MRNRQTPRTTRILSSDYAQSENRAVYLQEVIIDANDAEAVLKYADRFLANIEQETLDKLKKPNANYEELASYYRVASRFYDMLVTSVELGKQKAKALDAISRASTRRN